MKTVVIYGQSHKGSTYQRKLQRYLHVELTREPVPPVRGTGSRVASYALPARAAPLLGNALQVVEEICRHGVLSTQHIASLNLGTR